MERLKGRKVVVTGATGLIGSALVSALVAGGALVIAFVRNPGRAAQVLPDGVEIVPWDFEHSGGGSWRERLHEADAVVHLAGTPLFARRWSSSFKRKIEESRVEGTRLLVDTILEGEGGPDVFVSASAVGIYGTDASLEAREGHRPAEDFLASVCVSWEQEAHRLRDRAIRVVNARFGVVLDPSAGALKEMLPLFKFAMGGVLGRPDTWINWIHIDDVVCILKHMVTDRDLEGPYDVVAPNPVTNEAFGRSVARVLNRPFWMRYPQGLMRLMIGEASEFISGGAKVRADRLVEAGYRFRFSDLDSALRDLLDPRGRTDRSTDSCRTCREAA